MEQIHQLLTDYMSKIVDLDIVPEYEIPGKYDLADVASFHQFSSNSRKK